MIRFFYGVRGYLQDSVSSEATLLLVDAAMAGRIASSFSNGNDEAYFVVYSGGESELVKLIGVEGNYLSVERGQEGTTPTPFPAGAAIEHALSVMAVAAMLGDSQPVPNIHGSGLVNVSAENDGVNIAVERPTFDGENGISVIGSWPDYKITYTQEGNACCGPTGGGSEGGIQYVEGTNIDAWVSGDTLYLEAQTPYFQGRDGISVEGSWPDYTIRLTSGGGGSGTVTSVAVSSGLTLTGNPNINPTISIANTGVQAGDYGGVVINARGQITQVPTGFNPISAITTENEAIAIVREGPNVALELRPAAIGVAGIAPLADPTDDFDPADETSIATPAVIASALESLVLPSVAGADSFIGESDGAYTNTVSGSATAIELAAGEKAIVYAEATMYSPIDRTRVPEFGIGVFNAAPARVRSNMRIPQAQQHMSFVLTGPLNTSIALVTTAVPDGFTLASWSLWVNKI